ncbi:hypothetical protein ABPG72_003872 [Tetrahymena utriculariae]
MQRKSHEKWLIIKQALVNLDQNGQQYANISSQLKDTKKSLSGWVKHVGPPTDGRKLIATLGSQVPVIYDQAGDCGRIGDCLQILFLNYDRFEVTTSSYNNAAIRTKVSFDISYYQDQWFYFYLGYKKNNFSYYINFPNHQPQFGVYSDSDLLQPKSSYYTLTTVQGEGYPTVQPSVLRSITVRFEQGAYKIQYDFASFVPPAFDRDDTCPVLFSECDFKGQSQNLCGKNPKLPFIVKSVYVPLGQTVTLYSGSGYTGSSKIYNIEQKCIDDKTKPKFFYAKTMQKSSLKRQI